MGLVHVAGNAALDFVGTVSERGHARVEELRAPATLGEWFVAAGLVDEVPAVTTADLAHAKDLREQLYEIVCAITENGALPSGARAVMNTWASRPRPAETVDAEGHRRRAGTADQCLAAVAAAAVELFGRTDGAVIRWCADPQCTHPFLDRSRTHQRRWCDMASCGDRAKARAYRRRRAPEGESSPPGQHGAL